MIPVARLNHAVLYVRDAEASAEFYARVFGFEVVSKEFGGRAVFMRSAGGDNHHDLGLFAVGPDAPRAPRGATGLYHLAWEVPTIEDLAIAAFEIMWRVPREAWGEYEQRGTVMPLDLDAEVRRWGAPAGPVA
jgi:catechol 2,3-dioxygenase-like lactoylglutathione lyase family enzyme